MCGRNFRHERRSKARAKVHEKSGLRKWLKCKEGFDNEMCLQMTIVEAVEVSFNSVETRASCMRDANIGVITDYRFPADWYFAARSTQGGRQEPTKVNRLLPGGRANTEERRELMPGDSLRHSRRAHERRRSPLMHLQLMHLQLRRTDGRLNCVPLSGCIVLRVLRNLLRCSHARFANVLLRAIQENRTLLFGIAFENKHHKNKPVEVSEHKYARDCSGLILRLLAFAIGFRMDSGKGSGGAIRVRGHNMNGVADYRAPGPGAGPLFKYGVVLHTIFQACDEALLRP